MAVVMTGREDLHERLEAALRTVHDPEIPVNIFDLGLIYRCAFTADGEVDIDMTLTAPNCPVADRMPDDVRRAAEGVDGIGRARVTLTFEPKWSPEMMSEIAEIELEAMGIDPKRAKDSIGHAGSRATGLTIGRRERGRR